MLYAVLPRALTNIWFIRHRCCSINLCFHFAFFYMWIHNGYDHKWWCHRAEMLKDVYGSIIETNAYQMIALNLNKSQLTFVSVALLFLRVNVSFCACTIVTRRNQSSSMVLLRHFTEMPSVRACVHACVHMHKAIYYLCPGSNRNPQPFNIKCA